MQLFFSSQGPREAGLPVSGVRVRGAQAVPRDDHHQVSWRAGGPGQNAAHSLSQPWGGFVKIISVGTPTYAGMKTGV